LNRIYFKEKTECDRLIVTVKKAHGIDRARIYEIRTY